MMYRYLTLSILMIISVDAFSAGFASPIQGASGLGNAYAGAAASALDATTIFPNPAGMTYLPDNQFVIANHLLRPSAKFNDEGSTKAIGVPPRGDEGGDTGSLIVMPTIFYSHRLDDSLRLGIGVNSPFGLKTEYDDDWVGRFQSVKSQLKTININPSIAYKFSDQLSFGAGISFMRAEAELTRSVNRVVQPESFVTIKGDDWGIGYNFGLIYQMTTSSRIGLSYRSRVELKLDGNARFDGPLSVNNVDVKTNIITPETLSFSTFTLINHKWDFLTDISLTRWSRFKEINITRNDGSSLTNLPQNWSNSLRYSIGANYHLNEAVNLRAGLAYDQEAFSDEERQVRIPANDRTWLSLGASWQRSAKSRLDFGYTHIFVKDADIDQNQNTAAQGFNGHVMGTYEAHSDIVGIQYTRTVD